jgi:actin-related protein 10
MLQLLAQQYVIHQPNLISNPSWKQPKIFQALEIMTLENVIALNYFLSFRLGFAAEPCPRFIIPTEVRNSANGKHKKLFDYKNQQELYDQMVEFVQKLFFKYVLVSPKDRKVVIVESVLCPTDIRETLAKVLFCHFEVPSIFFVPSHLVVLATLSQETALVVDIGYKEAVVIPVYCGVQVLNAWQAQPLAAEAVHEEIKGQLILNGVKEELLSEGIVEDIKGES